MANQAHARVEHQRRLPSADLAAVSALVDAATEADGVHPLSEHAMLDLLSSHEGRTTHLLVLVKAPDEDEQIAGYAYLDPGETGTTEPASAEVVVHPRYRKQGVGRLLVHELEQAVPTGQLRLWAHGQLPAAAALAASLGYVVSRELWQMRRSLAQSLPEVELPEGFVLRAFRPGTDDEAWVTTNAAAFAHHPEQGSWTLDDLRRRMDEPWFDASGFLVLDDADGAMAGFHWTKVHDAEGDQAAIGEVYVVGVSPAHQGRGLGRTLTVAGLRHLRDRGLREAMLYVDGDNTAAVHTYSRLGFTRYHVDVQLSPTH